MQRPLYCVGILPALDMSPDNREAWIKAHTCACLYKTTSIGTFIDQTKVSREFKHILSENDLPDIRFHDLHHTSISILLDIGTPVNTVQRRAGHSKASVTTDIYGHVMAHSQDAAAENIEEIVKPLTNVSQ